MKYTPQELTGNVNAPPQHPLRELFVLLGGLIGIGAVVFIILGWLVNVVVDNLSPATEQKIEQPLAALTDTLFEPSATGVGAETELQRIVDELQRAGGYTQQTYRVALVDNPDVNALALPGGRIVVWRGLINAAESENELAMVLAHELGHFAQRDHLRGLGRGLVLLALSTVLFGGDDAVSGVVQRSLAGTDLKFSRQQELAADAWGLKLLASRYGHVGGSTDFFRRAAGKEKLPQWADFAATHPASAKRLAALEKQLAASNYREEPRQPLPAALRH